jgi:Flp pilus assembly protein TadG
MRMVRWMNARWRRQDGTALIETAFTLPILLFISISVIEFGRAYQAFQVVTNAAREGARIAVLPGTSDDAVTSRVQAYLQAGQIPNPTSATVAIDRNTSISIGSGTATASRVEVDYPFSFMVLQPVARLVAGGSSSSTLGSSFTMTAAATMRNE